MNKAAMSPPFVVFCLGVVVWLAAASSLKQPFPADTGDDGQYQVTARSLDVPYAALSTFMVVRSVRQSRTSSNSALESMDDLVSKVLCRFVASIDASFFIFRGMLVSAETIRSIPTLNLGIEL